MKILAAPYRDFARGFRGVLPRPFRSAIKRVLGLMSAPKARVRLGIGVQPLSRSWGFDRGLPIHRYYLEQFLLEFSSDIRGHCLEFQEDAYASRFRGGEVTKLDILHKEKGNPHATIVADLTQPNGIPSDVFDCIICTHVLHAVFELDKAIAELRRILKPGGALLIAVPHVSKYDPRFGECWRFTPEGLRLALTRVFGAGNVTVRAYGNSLTAAGEIRGLVAYEFARSELDYHDEGFAVEVCARAVRSLDTRAGTL